MDLNLTALSSLQSKFSECLKLLSADDSALSAQLTPLLRSCQALGRDLVIPPSPRTQQPTGILRQTVPLDDARLSFLGQNKFAASRVSPTVTVSPRLHALTCSGRPVDDILTELWESVLPVEVAITSGAATTPSKFTFCFFCFFS